MAKIAGRSVSALLIGAISIVLSLSLFFLLNRDYNALDWAGILFILAAELIAAVGFMLLDRAAERSCGLMVRSGGFVVLGVYSIAAIGVSLFFMIILKRFLSAFIAIQLVLLAAAAILLILILVSARSVALGNAGEMESVIEMGLLADRVDLMRENPENAPLSRELKTLYEELKYCDGTASSLTDFSIREKVDRMEQFMNLRPVDWEGEVRTLIRQASALVKQRASEVRTVKRGGI